MFSYPVRSWRPRFFLLGLSGLLVWCLPAWCAAPARRVALASPPSALAIPEADWLAAVAEQTPFITSDCPACGRPHLTRGATGGFWQFEYPGTLRCSNCGTPFPNEKFPLQGSAVFLNPKGENVTVRYYEAPGGKRFYLAGALASVRNDWMLTELTALAQRYRQTRDEAAARRIIVTLDRFAQKFPHYLVKDFQTTHDIPGHPEVQHQAYVYVSTGGPWIRNGKRFAEKPTEEAGSADRTHTPYGWTESRWGWGRWGGELPMTLAEDYAAVKESPEFARVSAEAGYDVRRHIVDDLFREAAAYVMEFPFWYQLNNNASGHIGALVRLGRMIDEPAYVHFGYRWAREVLEKYNFSRDGAFAESPGYIYVFLASQLGNFSAFSGYSDPAGYVGADGLNLHEITTGPMLDFLKKTRDATESLRFPNGSVFPVGDSRNDEYTVPGSRPNVLVPPRTESQATLLPGYGHAMLADGTADQQVQAHLHFSTFTHVNHAHADGLSLMLWAFGTECFTDIGYHKSYYRGYATTTLSHNTVVVDRTEQAGADTKGRLLAFESRLPGVSLVQVDDTGAYAERCTRYRRTLLLNSSDLAAPYLVDVFEVRGGTVHDFVLHGPTLYESRAETDLPLTPVAGARPFLDAGVNWSPAVDTRKFPYGVFTSVRSGAATRDFAVTFTIDDPYALPEFVANPRDPAGKTLHYEVDPAVYRDRRPIGVRSHFIVTGQDQTLFLAESPSLTRSGLSGSALTDKLKRPSLLLRHEGKSGELRSVFVAVHEPFYGSPHLKAVRALPTTVTDGSVVALEIETATGLDTVLLALDGDEVRTTGAAPAFLQGRVGLVTTGPAGSAADVIDGSAAGRGEIVVRHPPAEYRGVIERVTSRWDGAPENAFVTPAALPEGEALRGACMIVREGTGGVTEGYFIDHIARRGNRTWILLTDEPGLRLNGEKGAETFFPRRQFTGECRFTIPTSSRAQFARSAPVAAPKK